MVDLSETDVLGFDFGLAPAPSAGEPAVVIRLKDVHKVVASQGGATGALAYGVAPQTITKQAYARVRDEIAAGMRAKGVDADVSVTMSPPTGKAPKSDFLAGTAVGAGVLGVGWVLWRLFQRK